MDGMVEDANSEQAHPLEVLAIVQARGGSKTIPRKNLRLLAGHPLVAYSIASGLAAESVTRLIVSTDDTEIASVCRAYGAEVPFLRPAEFAEDATPDLPLFQHALDWLEKHEGYQPDLIVQLRPTSPLRPLDSVDRAIATLSASPQADCVRGVTIPNQSPYKMWRLAEDGFLKPLLSSGFVEPYNMPRQHLPMVYWQTGHIDVIRYETIVKGRSLTGKWVLPVMIDPLYWVDIDTEADWSYAEWLINNNRLPIHQPHSSTV
jgi:CMP-N-acetylneuraminic acid synthetase